MADNQLFEKYGQTFRDGERIFDENAPGDRMYIIQEGQVRITKVFDGKQHVLSVLGKGDFFGEMAIVSRIRRTASATAIGETRLLAFDRDGFQSMIEKNARIALNVIDKLSRRLQHANQQIQTMFERNKQSLVALNLYLRFAERPQDQQVITLDRAVDEIALQIEVPEVRVLEAVNELVKAGALEQSGNALRLKDRALLTRLSQDT